MAIMSAGAFKRYELFQTEQEIMRTLNYKLLAPDLSTFFCIFLEIPELQRVVVPTPDFILLTEFYLEVSTLNFSLQLLKPSILCAAAIFLSAHTLGRAIWSKPDLLLKLFTKKEQTEILACMANLHHHIISIQTENTFTHTLQRFGSVSSITPILPAEVYVSQTVEQLGTVKDDLHLKEKAGQHSLDMKPFFGVTSSPSLRPRQFSRTTRYTTEVPQRLVVRPSMLRM
ncbi:hypothetical protein Pelo_18623 [Pelomyxa schiedti]|nr:hypothetical protein Pelo_18623 [Pelomyxa schiedti]